MDRELRILVTRGKTERLLIDQLTEAVEEARRSLVSIANPAPAAASSPSAASSLVACGSRLMADPDRPDFGRGLEYPTGNFSCVQRKPKRQSANAGSDDEDVVHVFLPARFVRRFAGDETRLVRSLSIQGNAVAACPA